MPAVLLLVTLPPLPLVLYTGVGGCGSWSPSCCSRSLYCSKNGLQQDEKRDLPGSVPYHV